MLAKSPITVVPGLSPATYKPHALHAHTGHWRQGNTSVDLWIEILHALGEDPRAALGFAVSQDFEGDHFTMPRVPAEDLFELFGFEVQEFAIYDTLEAHIVAQTSRGRMVVLELGGTIASTSAADGFGACKIAVNRIDPANRELDYFDGRGLHTLSGQAYETMMRQGSEWLPVRAEFIKFDRRKKLDPAVACDVFCRHLARAPLESPVLAFREHVKEQAPAAAQKDPGLLATYARNTFGHLGLNFSLLGSHMAWLCATDTTLAPFAPVIEACRAVSDTARAADAKFAGAVAQDDLDSLVAPLVSQYARIFDGFAAI